MFGKERVKEVEALNILLRQHGYKLRFFIVERGKWLSLVDDEGRIWATNNNIEERLKEIVSHIR